MLDVSLVICFRSFVRSLLLSVSFFALVFLFVCFVRSFAVCYLLFRLLVFVCMLCLFLSSLSVLLSVIKCGS